MNETTTLKSFLETNDKKNKVISDVNFQRKLIKLLIEDEKFSEQIMEIVSTDYFDNIHHKLLIKHVIDYYKKYNIIPKYDTIKDIVNDKESEGIQKENLLELANIIQTYQITDGQYIKDTALNFCKKQSLKKGMKKAISAWEVEDYDSIKTIIDDALKIGEPRENGHDYFDDVEKRMTQQHRNPIPVMRGLDAKIGGGLAGGELCVILSPTGGGKSMVLVKFACTALEHGKKVVYYSLELSEKVIAHRFDSCLNNIPLKHVIEYSPAIKTKILELKEKGARLFVKEFPTGGASVNTIKAHLKTLQRENNFIPDIIFIDYADIMKSTTSFSEKRHLLTSIYEHLRGMSMEFNVPVITAAQTNRSGFNSSKFDLSVISESIGKAQTADVILGIARSDEDKMRKKANLMILKNRNGEDGFNIPLMFDTSKVDISVEEQSYDNKMNIKGLNMEREIIAKEKNKAQPVIVDDEPPF